MKKWVLYFLVIVSFITIQINFVFAREGNDEEKKSGEILVLNYDQDTEKKIWTAVKGKETKGDIKKKCRQLFTMLLTKDYNNNYTSFLPEKTQLLQVIYGEGLLGLNFSKEILEYGGNTWEYSMVNQILYTGFSLSDIKMITIYIDGQSIPFTEGTEIIEYTRETWQKERMNLLCSEMTKEDMMKYDQ